jgi:hypothetical protein
VGLAGVDARDAVRVRIVSVENPTRQDFLLRVLVEVPGPEEAGRWELGLANPFPPDQPATFDFSLPAGAAQAMESADGSPTLVVELVPAVPRPLLPPLVVSVSTAPASGP